MVSNTVNPEQMHLLTQVANSAGLLAIVLVPLPERESILFDSQERSGVASNFRSQFETLSQNKQVQNTDNQNYCISYSVQGLVSENQS